MNTKIKDALGVIIILFLLAALGNAIRFVNFYSKSIEPSSFRSFNVDGEGKAIRVPDIAEFTFSVITEGGTQIAPIQKENIETTNRVIAFVKSMDILEKDMRTQQFELNPRYDYSSDRGSQLIGYTMRQTVLVKIRDFDKISPLLSGVIEQGANTVSQLSFTLDDPTKAESEARAEAIRKAQEKAQEIAKTTGFKLGRLLSIQENGTLPPYYSYESKSTAYNFAQGQRAQEADIEAGEQEVNVNVTLTYEIE